MVIKKIISKNSYDYCLNYIGEKLKHRFPDNRLLLKTKKSGDYTLMQISCQDEVNLSLLENAIDALISDVICNYYKYDYFKCCIDKKIKDETFKKILLKTLVAFDVNLDRLSILFKLPTGKTVSLDGIFNFAIADVKNRWNDILSLVKSGLVAMGSYKCTEILKILMENMGNQYEQVHVYENIDGYVFKDKDSKEIAINELLVKDESRDMKLIITLIGLAPKQIYLHFNDQIKPEVYELISTIFQ